MTLVFGRQMNYHHKCQAAIRRDMPKESLQGIQPSSGSSDTNNSGLVLRYGAGFSGRFGFCLYGRRAGRFFTMN